MGSDRTQKRTITSNETLFDVIQSLMKLEAAGVTDLARDLGLAKSTVHKHLVSLERRRYVVKEGTEYRLGLQFFNTGNYVLDQYDIYHAATERMDRLADETGETTWLTIPENGRGMIVYGAQGDQTFSVDSTIGTWVYLHTNSAGKSILAHFSEDRVQEIIDRYGLPARTENTITEYDELVREMQTIRDRGYALSFQEGMWGLHAMAMPIIEGNCPVAAVSLAGPADRITEERIQDELHQSLLEAVHDIKLRFVYG